MRILSYQWDNINKEQREPPKMHIIYRLCDQRINTHMKGVTKVDCINNFVSVFGKKNLTIIADNCGNPSNLMKVGCSVVITKLGNAESLRKAFEMAIKLPDNNYVYLVEDDYLHKPSAKELILEGLEVADFVTLYDHADKYSNPSPNPHVKNGGEISRVLLTKSCHWKETNSTTMTFACKVSILKKYKDIMIKYLDQETPRDFEMWTEILRTSRLISSIPGYSTHCHTPWEAPLWNLKIL